MRKPAVPRSEYRITNLPDSLVIARTMGTTVPDTIQICGIIIPELGHFSEGLSPALAVRVPNIVSVLAEEVRPQSGPYRGSFGRSNPQKEKHSWKKTV